MVSDYAPFTGFGPTWNTQARFGVYFDSDKFSDWFGGVHLPMFEMSGGDSTVSQNMGREPLRITMHLFFESVKDFEYFDSMQGYPQSLRYIWGVTRTAGGTLQSHAGLDYLVVPNVFLESVTRVQSDGLIDGTWECVATFRTDYVAPVIPDIEPVPAPTEVFPLPVVLLMSPGGSYDEAGPVTPTLSGSARVVETDVPAPGYDEIAPAGKNWARNPRAAIDLTHMNAAGGNSITRQTGLGWTHPVTGELIDTGVLANTSVTNACSVAAHDLALASPAGTPVCGQLLLKADPAFIGQTVQIMLYAGGGANAAVTLSGSAASVVMTGEVQYLQTPVALLDYADRTQLNLYFQMLTGGTNKKAIISAFQVEIATTPTPFFDGDTNELTAWTSTPNGSPSTRQRTPSVPAWEVLENTTNYFPNPLVNSTTGWGVVGGAVSTHIPSGMEFINPDTGKAVLITTDGVAGASGCVLISNTLTSLGLDGATPWTTSTNIVMLEGSATNIYVSTRINYTDATSTEGPQLPPVIDAKGRVTVPPFTGTAGKTIQSVQMHIRTIGIKPVTRFLLAMGQIEQKAYATPPTPRLDPVTGNPYPGYAWTGTVHASTSTRAAGGLSATYADMANLLAEGEVLIHSQPGAKVSGSGWVWHTGNYGPGEFLGGRHGSAAQQWWLAEYKPGAGTAISTPPTVLATNGERHILDARWDANTIQSRVDDGTLQSVARPARGGTVSTTIFLGSYSNTQHINGLIFSAAFFNRPLTPLERERLDDLSEDFFLEWSDFQVN